MRLFPSSILSLTAITILCGAAEMAAAPPSVPPPDDEKQSPPPPARETEPERGPQRQQALPMDRAKAAWELQAGGVAQRLALTQPQREHTIKAYVETRQNLRTQLQAMRDELTRGAGAEGDNAPDRPERAAEFQEKMRELMAAQREKLASGLRASLTQEQTDQAMQSLGTFNARWDGMADALIGFKLEQAKLDQSTAAIEPYIIASSAVLGAEDRAAARQTMQDARVKMMETLKQSLTEEQLAAFERTAGGRGGEGRGQRRPRGDGGGQPGAPGAPGAPGNSERSGDGSGRDD